MKTASEQSLQDISQLKKMNAELQLMVEKQAADIQAKDTKIQWLIEQFRLAQHQRFGSSSESHPDQGDLFNEVELLEDEAVANDDQTTETVTYERSKPKRKPLPKDLPREIILHDIEEADKVCDCCGGDLHCIGEDTSEKLAFIPAQVKVIEHIRPKYSCRQCEKETIRVVIKVAPVPASPIPKSIATPSLLSQIITAKYQYALPLYRQESLFKQYGIDLNRKTMSSWMIRCAELLKPVVERLTELQLQQPVIHADETPVKVVLEEKTTGYMWVYCTGADSPPTDKSPPDHDAIRRIAIYDYQSSRGSVCPKSYLQDFKGYLQVDGYVGYEKVEATLVGCMAHARRKFTDAKKAQPKGKTGKADKAIAIIQKLYRIETEIKVKVASEKHRLRQEKALPLLNCFKVWLDESALHIPPKTVLGKAIGYAIRQWHKLIRYLEDGHLNIDNNRAERAIKPFVIGRKNWLFSYTVSGANASAVLYSLIETAKANGIIPFDYLNWLLEELPKNPDNIDALLPWMWDC
ncbi:MAG: IS66 family transposase [Thiotrichaceae bacterium]